MDRRAVQPTRRSSSIAPRSTGSTSISARTSGRLPGLLDHAGRRVRRQRQGRPRRPRAVPGQAGGVAPWDLTDAIDSGATELRRHPAPPHARGRRASPARGDGHAAPPLRGDAAARRLRSHQRKRGGRAARRQAVPGQEGAYAVAPARARRAWPGRSSCSPPPTSTCGARPRGPKSWCSRCSWPASAGWDRGQRRGPGPGGAARAWRKAWPRASSAGPCGSTPGSCGWRPWRRPCRCA